ncbi:cysteine hydrolase family protein [Cryobacterium aureum]|uniref:cysteine hydrolase family protein n=1 Tax=Cryobacterium aureum TaxID=995037 RepID=UPI000CF3728A|nr:isochorismatase family cysteine hydrolase [Cryobacterium aureum]
MIIVDGKQIYTELKELVEPSHTALVIVDMQRDFIEPDGAFGIMGIDLSMYHQSRPRLHELLKSSRENGVLVIHIQNTSLPGRASDSPAQIRFNQRMHSSDISRAEPLIYTRPGTPGFDFVEELLPIGDELVVRKYRSSAFWGTNLDLLLRSNGIETVIVTGCTTEGCVESTARDAMFANYYVVLATDCVASDDPEQHDASMLLMRHRFDMATEGEIRMAWESTSTALPI